MHDNRQLLCTFSNAKTFKETIGDIKRFYSMPPAKFFVFANENNLDEMYITYNTSPSTNGEYSKFPNTISVHRKKHVNCIFSLNAMNQIIRDENEGVFDRNHEVKWEYYKNSLIIKNEISIKIIPLKLVHIISV